MKPLRVDFRREKPPPRLLWWALALAVLGLASAGWAAWHEWRGVADQRRALRQAHAAKQAEPVVKAPTRPPSPYDASAREMLMQHAAPWPQALTAIETVAIVGVTPVGVEYAANDKSSMRLEVSFTEYAKLLEYVDALNAGEPDLKWVLVQSQFQPGGAPTAVIFGERTRR